MCGHHLLPGAHLYPGDHRDAEALARTPSSTRTTPCPQCHSLLQEDFVFCPHCGAEALTTCPVCHRAVHTDWTHCAYCRADLLAGGSDVSTHSPH